MVGWLVWTAVSALTHLSIANRPPIYPAILYISIAPVIHRSSHDRTVSVLTLPSPACLQALVVVELSSRRQLIVPLHDLLHTNTPTHATAPPSVTTTGVSPVMALHHSSPLLAVGVGTRVAVLHVDALLRVEGGGEGVLVTATADSTWLR